MAFDGGAGPVDCEYDQEGAVIQTFVPRGSGFRGYVRAESYVVRVEADRLSLGQTRNAGHSSNVGLVDKSVWFGLCCIVIYLAQKCIFTDGLPLILMLDFLDTISLETSHKSNETVKTTIVASRTLSRHRAQSPNPSTSHQS